MNQDEFAVWYHTFVKTYKSLAKLYSGEEFNTPNFLQREADNVANFVLEKYKEVPKSDTGQMKDMLSNVVSDAIKNSIKGKK
jgi:hypothetical protein